MFYQKHLKRLGLIVSILVLFNIIVSVLVLFSRGDFLASMRRPDILIRPSIGLVTGLIIYFSAKNAWLRERGFFLVLILTCIYAFMTFFGEELEDALDVSLLLMLVSTITLYETNRADRAWKKILRNTPITLDIRILKRSELFDPVVLMPHLEVNQKVTDAIDHLLRTSRTTAPLRLNVHCGENVSESLQNTFSECLRMHYRDERDQVLRFLEGRYARMIGLLMVSIVALVIWTTTSPAEDAGEKVLWQILGNFAAFSLWQIGATHFERSEGYARLMQFTTAENLSVSFHGK
ncbi:MAG: hypothetical protein IJ088_03805 [Clostridia bacterium]|nr:hypothetical protein [Clostridia bacterium]